MPFKHTLPCGQDPRLIGIEDDQGDWNGDDLLRHLALCQPCCRLVSKIFDTLAQHYDDLAEADSP